MLLLYCIFDRYPQLLSSYTPSRRPLSASSLPAPVRFLAAGRRKKMQQCSTVTLHRFSRQLIEQTLVVGHPAGSLRRCRIREQELET